MTMHMTRFQMVVSNLSQGVMKNLMDHRMHLEVLTMHTYRLYRLTGIGPRPVVHLDLNHHHIVIIYDLGDNMTHNFF